MIFDCDTHMSPYRNFDGAVNVAELDERLEKAGVDRALVWLLPQGVEDVSESNRYIYDSVRNYPRFAAPFGWANVREGEQKAIDDARICLQEYGFKGVKLNGAQNDYKIDSAPAVKVCEEIARNNGIIAFHIGADFPDNTSAARAANVARAFPETIMLMIHMGGAGEPDFSDDVISAAKECGNMMLVGSSIHIDRVKNAIEQLGSGRVMFGSDEPFVDVRTRLVEYADMLRAFSAKERDDVMGQNANRIFGL